MGERVLAFAKTELAPQDFPKGQYSFATQNWIGFNICCTCASIIVHLEKGLTGAEATSAGASASVPASGFLYNLAISITFRLF